MIILPGTRIQQALIQLFRISGFAGCGCDELAREMNEVGPEKIKANLDYYVERMFKSIKKWRTMKKTPIPQPPKIVIKSFILWACTPTCVDRLLLSQSRDVSE